MDMDEFMIAVIKSRKVVSESSPLKTAKQKILAGLKRSYVVLIYASNFSKAILQFGGKCFLIVLFYLKTATFIGTIFRKCAKYLEICSVVVKK